MDDLARHLTERYNALKDVRCAWDTLWTDIAQYIVPRRYPGMNGSTMTPGTQTESLLFDTTAVQANMTLANGQLAWMTPLESPWFAFDPADGQGDDVKRWLSTATTKTRQALAVSNFYTAVHEFYLDRGAFGTACLYVEPGRRWNINAECWPVGTWVIDVDETGDVDTVIREFKLTARQAVQKFGEDKVPESVRKCAKEGGGKALEKAEYLHAIYPREDSERDKNKQDDVNMPWASVYLHKADNHVCKNSGYPERPFMVSRYLEWGSGLGDVYGWSPAFAALPEARQVNFLQKMMDALAEKMAFPPLLAPEAMEGEIDPNAMGVTYFSQDIAQMLPKEWMTAGRYDIGLQRVAERQKAIEKAFHVDLFQMFAQLEKQMTAREVMERSQEKLIQFSPTFSRLTNELLNPLLERVFSIMLRLGKLGDVTQIPRGLVQIVGNGMANVPTPEVQYMSRIALALRALPQRGWLQTLERLSISATMQPAVLDNFDFDEAERTAAMSDGVPPEYLHTESDVEKGRDARAKAQQAMMQQQQMATAADAAAKVGGIPAESPVGKAIEKAIPKQ